MSISVTDLLKGITQTNIPEGVVAYEHFGLEAKMTHEGMRVHEGLRKLIYGQILPETYLLPEGVLGAEELQDDIIEIIIALANKRAISDIGLLLNNWGGEFLPTDTAEALARRAAAKENLANLILNKIINVVSFNRLETALSGVHWGPEPLMPPIRTLIAERSSYRNVTDTTKEILLFSILLYCGQEGGRPFARLVEPLLKMGVSANAVFATESVSFNALTLALERGAPRDVYDSLVAGANLHDGSSYFILSAVRACCHLKRDEGRFRSERQDIIFNLLKRGAPVLPPPNASQRQPALCEYTQFTYVRPDTFVQFLRRHAGLVMPQYRFNSTLTEIEKKTMTEETHKKRQNEPWRRYLTLDKIVVPPKTRLHTAEILFICFDPRTGRDTLVTSLKDLEIILKLKGNKVDIGKLVQEVWEADPGKLAPGLHAILEPFKSIHEASVIAEAGSSAAGQPSPPSSSQASYSSGASSSWSSSRATSDVWSASSLAVSSGLPPVSGSSNDPLLVMYAAAAGSTSMAAAVRSTSVASAAGSTSVAAAGSTSMAAAGSTSMAAAVRSTPVASAAGSTSVAAATSSMQVKKPMGR